MNIALIIVDTLRADHADPLYHEAQKQGWTTAKAIAPATWTLPSHISMITGLYPSQHGVDERAPPAQDAKRARVALKATDHGILGKLRREGYHIYILTANPYLTPHFGFTLHDELHFLRRREATTKTFHALTQNNWNPLKAATALIRQGELKTLIEAAAKYITINIAKHIPQIHKPAPPFDKGAAAIMKKLEEIELKKPYLLIINLMEAHAPYTRTEGWAELSYLVPRIYNAVMCTGQAPKWAVRIWTQAYPQHARHAAQAALQIAKKLDAHIIITSDHGEALGPALFHGIPPTPQLAEVPLATTIPTKIEGIISLTEIPHLILQATKGQTPRLGQKIAKTEYHETPRRHPCAKHRKITLYYTQKGHKTAVQEY
jgi:arylsulfatase A-like enzyme